jgi:diguanylate cyclase (GGDEF)-like protein
MATIVLLYTVQILSTPLPPAIAELFEKFASSAVFFGAAALCVSKGLRKASERLAWYLFAVAMVLWGSASVYYSLLLWDKAAVPVPSAADGLWLAFYLPAFAALCLLLRKRATISDREVWLDAAIGGFGVGGGAAALVFGIVLAHSQGTPIAVATNLAYPVGDLGLMALVVALISVTGWRRSGGSRWIVGAFALFAVADSVWLVQAATGSYVAGTVLDLGWPAAALLVGIAAWRPDQPFTTEMSSGGRIAVPAIAGFTALVLLTADHFVRTNALALGLAVASTLIILIRLCWALRDNSRLLVLRHGEARTDALTGLANRRVLSEDLTDRLSELDPAQPLTLSLFDLDGFKEYNDTFGHPAGDRLLERLGERLALLIGGHGGAYRMGGDEFCTVSQDGDESVSAAEAAGALSEDGVEMSVGCSYGSVLLPSETTDADEALRIADRRLYSQKRGGRASAGQQSCDVLLLALAERDAGLAVHLRSVADMATATAIELGVRSRDLEAVRQTALLHDIGKVAIPDEILSKPHPLGEAEWAFVQRHTEIGERIVSAAPALAGVAKYVRSTHERFDGSGYPDGLCGKDVPMISSIVAVCDSYDAMVSDRAYREPCHSAAAVAELKRCSGTQFDPAVVEAFVASVPVADASSASDRDRQPLGSGRRVAIAEPSHGRDTVGCA